MNTPAIDRLNIEMSAEPIRARPDNLLADMPAGSRHYKVTLRRHSEEMVITWTCGPAIKSDPTVAEVLDNLLCSWQGSEYEFAEFCREFGYSEEDADPDNFEFDEDDNLIPPPPSIARQTYAAAQAHSADLSRLFPDYNIEELTAIIADDAPQARYLRLYAAAKEQQLKADAAIRGAYGNGSRIYETHPGDTVHNAAIYAINEGARLLVVADTGYNEAMRHYASVIDGRDYDQPAQVAKYHQDTENALKAACDVLARHAHAAATVIALLAEDDNE